MIEKDLSIILIGNNKNNCNINNIDFIVSDNNSLIEIIKQENSKYIVFIKEEDNVSSNYLDNIKKKVAEDFDCCFINFSVNYNYSSDIKILKNENELNSKKPYYGEYIWSFIFKREKLIDLFNYNGSDYNQFINKIFSKTSSITDIIYYHNPTEKKYLDNFIYTDKKDTIYFKNLIYIGSGCNCVFNGYVSWLNNISLCFKNKFEITVLYDKIWPPTLEKLSNKFNMVERNYTVNYTCDNLLCIYTEYFYPKNIFPLYDSYLFIHGNMKDFDYATIYTDDIYNNYIAVSKIAAKKASGYFPTNNIKHIYNPFKLDKSLVKPHLKLVSAQRYSNEKGSHRIEILANILDELEIPYTWNVFTDKYEGANKNGLIYRNRTYNPLPYINDCDYFVLLSDSEACPYSIIEALSVNTKVIVTPLEAFYELGVKDNKNGFVIPFEYFNHEHKDKLKELIIKIYNKKNLKVKNKLNTSFIRDYNNIFK